MFCKLLATKVQQWQDLPSAASDQMLRGAERKQRSSQTLLLPGDSNPKAVNSPTSSAVPVIANDSKDSPPSTTGRASEPGAEAAQRSGSASTPDRQQDAGQPIVRTSSAMSSVTGGSMKCPESFSSSRCLCLLGLQTGLKVPDAYSSSILQHEYLRWARQ